MKQSLASRPALLRESRASGSVVLTGVVAARLAVEVALAVAPRGRRFPRAVLRAEALHRGPGVDQGPVHREVVARQKPLHVPQPHQRAQELPRYIRRKQPVAVVREHRRMPDGSVHRQPDEPAEQQIVVDLLHQLALGAHREEGLQQRRPQQHLGRDRRPAHRRVQRLEAPVQRRQSLIRQPADRPQRVIRRNALLQPHVGEQPIRPIVPPAHAKSPPWLRSRNHRQSHQSRLFQQPAKSMIPKSGYRFSEKIMLKQRGRAG